MNYANAGMLFGCSEICVHEQVWLSALYINVIEEFPKRWTDFIISISILTPNSTLG